VGEVDAIWCGSAITEERRTVFDYSRPYAAFDEAVLVLSRSPIRSLDDLRGARVGAIVASTNMRLAETFGAAELVAFDGSSDDVFAEMIDAVRSGLIDAFVDDEPAFGGAVAGGEFRIAHIAETQNPWGAACRKGDGLVRGLIDDGIGAAIAKRLSKVEIGDGAFAATVIVSSAGRAGGTLRSRSRSSVASVSVSSSRPSKVRILSTCRQAYSRAAIVPRRGGRQQPHTSQLESGARFPPRARAPAQTRRPPASVGVVQQRQGARSARCGTQAPRSPRTAWASSSAGARAAAGPARQQKTIAEAAE